MSLISAIIKLHNKLSQKSVFEVDDGITSCDEIRELCRKVTAEGCVLLKNGGTLPLGNQQFALFGRCQINTFYVGYGSGGDVKPPYKVSILEGLQVGGANLDSQVAETYEHWTKNHIPDEGYWGHWPMCYKEMPVKDEFIASAAKRNTTAVVVIGRATCTTPQPKRMRPMARIREKMKSDRLFTTPSGSLAAKAGMERQQKHSTVAA